MVLTLEPFTKSFIRIRPGLPINFAGRPYLRAVYDSFPRSVVLRCSRQVEKSTFLANSILFELATRAGVRVLFVAPREQQANLFARLRILRSITDSPLLKRRLFGKGNSKHRLGDIEFRNGSVLHVRSAFSTADAARGLSIDSLYVDEFQDIAQGNLPVLQEAMSHAARPRTVLAGTPKLIENHLEAAYLTSRRNEWRIPCVKCGRECTPLFEIIAARGLQCPQCHTSLAATTGHWHALNPTAEMDGYWINHTMVPWLDHRGLLQRCKEYDDVRFKNEVLGIPTALGDHLVSLTDLEACCTRFPMAQSSAEIPPQYRDRLVAGIDWGGGGAAQTAICVGYLDESLNFHVVHFATFRGREDPKLTNEALTRICERFCVTGIAADRGLGFVNMFDLRERYNSPTPFTAITYAASTSAPTADGNFHFWTVDRTQTIGHVFARVRQKKITFPHFSESRRFLEELACEIAVFDDQRRTIRYSHPSNAPDDSLHACNYALLQAGRFHRAGVGNSESEQYDERFSERYDDSY